MPVRDWVQKLFGPGLKHSPEMSDLSVRRRAAWPRKDAVIEFAVNLSGLVNDQPGALAFYQVAFAEHPPQFRDIRAASKEG